jgi:LysR family transcriptional regulator, transcription activator of glutamate synthase operon
MEIKQLQYFLSVADSSSFSVAAENLYISQSSLSKQIIALEKELDVQLFDRSKRKIALTEAGGIFYKHAFELYELYKNILADLEEFRTIAASLSILAIPVIAQYEITSYIAQFKSTYPNINFTLEEREASVILPALNSHQYDLAFIRDNYMDNDLYSWLEISRDNLIVMVSNRHPYATKASVSLMELSNENFIMFDKGTIVHEISVDACRKAGFEPRIFYASLRVESVIGLVASNSGIALMMGKVFEYHKHPNVVAIRLDETIESNIVLARLKRKKLSRAARIFIEFMEKTLTVR